MGSASITAGNGVAARVVAPNCGGGTNGVFGEKGVGEPARGPIGPIEMGDGSSVDGGRGVIIPGCDCIPGVIGSASLFVLL